MAEKIIIFGLRNTRNKTKQTKKNRRSRFRIIKSSGTQKMELSEPSCLFRLFRNLLQLFSIEADDQMRALADDGAPDQVRLADDQFDEFFFEGSFSAKPRSL